MLIVIYLPRVVLFIRMRMHPKIYVYRKHAYYFRVLSSLATLIIIYVEVSFLLSLLTESSHRLLGLNLPLILADVGLFIYVLFVDIHFGCVYGTYFFNVAEQVTLMVNLKELEKPKEKIMKLKLEKRLSTMSIATLKLEMSNLGSMQSTTIQSPYMFSINSPIKRKERHL